MTSFPTRDGGSPGSWEAVQDRKAETGVQNSLRTSENLQNMHGNTVMAGHPGSDNIRPEGCCCKVQLLQLTLMTADSSSKN